MGWMSWEIFRCNLATPTDDCSDKSTTKCISEALYQGQADAMVSQGFANAGYASIHMDVRARAPLVLFLSLFVGRGATNHYNEDSSPLTHSQDCWEEKNPARDPSTGELRADSKRFPSGMKALGDYVHGKGLSFAIYSAESTETCGGYPASLNHEALDAQTCMFL